MNDFKIKPVSSKKKDFENFISEKITEMVQGIDSNRNFKNERIYFDDSIGGYDKNIPEDGDQVNNFSVEIEMNKEGRMRKVVIEMGFDYEEI